MKPTQKSRRAFLSTSALAAAACSVPSRALAAFRSSPPIRLGLASYTFRNFTRAQLIASLRQLSLSALNAKDTRDHLPTEPQQEAAALADYAAAKIQLHAAGTIAFDKDDDSDLRAKFDYAKRAGIDVIVAGDPAPGTLPRVEKFVKEFNIRVAIHNHGPEDKLWPSPLDILKAIQPYDSRIGCCIDVGHTARSGTDVVAALRAAGPRLYNIHMKDLADFHDKESQVAVGEGNMPVREIFQALIAQNYQGYVDLEYEIHPDDPLPGVTQSFTYMRRLLTSLS
ncbi:MAG TPA: sugar phosphate isomerase/epimerase [Candidatus Saccharimonadales bacterium]|nr:sugar phosphate isomerase/epimerase [Candidatus Saccharimonadales bacterium]